VTPAEAAAALAPVRAAELAAESDLAVAQERHDRYEHMLWAWDCLEGAVSLTYGGGRHRPTSYGTRSWRGHSESVVSSEISLRTTELLRDKVFGPQYDQSLKDLKPPLRGRGVYVHGVALPPEWINAHCDSPLDPDLLGEDRFLGRVIEAASLFGLDLGSADPRSDPLRRWRHSSQEWLRRPGLKLGDAERARGLARFLFNELRPLEVAANRLRASQVEIVARHRSLQAAHVKAQRAVGEAENALIQARRREEEALYQVRRQAEEALDQVRRQEEEARDQARRRVEEAHAGARSLAVQRAGEALEEAFERTTALVLDPVPAAAGDQGEAVKGPVVEPYRGRWSSLGLNCSITVQPPADGPAERKGWPAGQSASTLRASRFSAGRSAVFSLHDRGRGEPIPLDLEGGFMAAEKEPLEVATLQLLDRLPGGQLRVDVIDPAELGASAAFLYGLNDAGDRILADTVWTTPEQVADVLARLEERITFVTQKCLHGRSTLTEYNAEAGETAEPYRLLLVYDFPAGFIWAGGREQETLARLERVARVGRRAGVYLFIQGDPETVQGICPALADCLPAPTPGQTSFTRRRADQAAPDRYVRTLPAAAALGPDQESGGGQIVLSDLTWHWQTQLQPPPSAQQREAIYARLLRELEAAQTTTVDPAGVARLAERRQATDLARGLIVEPLTDLADPTTWWRASSAQRLQLTFGRMGASDVARVEFNSDLESSALIGGRTGSGKSTLIHALIMDAVTRYSPEELTLYLCDLKEGVEFKQYADARLPHARAIAIESNREFALSLLEALDQEIVQRAASFKAEAGGGTVSLPQFRRQSGQVWPRILVVIDEFHKLFEPDDQMARRALRLLERTIKEGRAFGVHLLLASQSLANVEAAFRNLVGQVPYRLVLASSDHDSRLLLGDDNAEAKSLTRAGEGVLNAKGGARESNQRFQTAFWAPQRRQTVLAAVEQLARERGFSRRPQVFEGNATVSAADFPPELFRGDGRHTTIPVGAPMSLAPPLTTALRRASGGNLLVVDPEGPAVMATLLTALLAQRVDLRTVNFAGLEDPAWEEIYGALLDAGAANLAHRRLGEAVDALAVEVQGRHDARAYGQAPIVLALLGLQRARDIDSSDYADGLQAKLKQLAQDGPEVGLHLVCWVDRKASLDRRFDSDLRRQFGLRLLGQMSAADSRALIDSELAATVSPAQLVFDDFDQAVTAVVRRLGFPGLDWLKTTVEAGRERRLR
jgi:DNA segregation ATPase FtsK/SpoIIIE-like protein